MNFFEHQAAAKRRSKRLVILFSLAVVAIVVAVDFVLLLALGGFNEETDRFSAVLFASVVTLAVIGCASLFRVASLRTGGAAVAHQLGATTVPEDTSDFNFRRLRNVVEEIAIASGVAVPQIFVLEDEDAINAFAAGYAPSDAAIVVTRGALTRLNRDELQGVIAHEFSHVLNGDMRLNIKLVGLLFGILVLTVIGKKILENSRIGRSKGTGPLLITGLGLMIVGSIGLFFGRMIKAGVSRQREYLADASAVQFTRQTNGIAGALKKLAGLQEGSRLSNADTEEVSHMLFGEGMGYSALMATHPPLLKRIQALEPSFKVSALNELSANWALRPPVGLDEDKALGFTEDSSSKGLPLLEKTFTISPPNISARVGFVQPQDYRRAGSLNGSLPEALRRAVHHQDDVIPLVFGLLYAPAGHLRDRQHVELKARIDSRVAQQALDYAESMSDLNPMLRLPLAALAFPLLRRRSRSERQHFIDTVYALIHADGQVSLFEYCLGCLLRTQVSESLDPAHSWLPGTKRLAKFTEPVVMLLAVVAQAGHDDPAEALRAYLAGLARVFPRLNAPYAPPTDVMAALDAAWPVLDTIEPFGKELLLEGLVAAISCDGQVTVIESELLRAICASLHCPLPPFLGVVL